MVQTKTPLEQLMEDRKSVRKYKEGVKIPREQLQHLIEQATSAPSSSNMQSWRFLVFDDQEQKKELRAIANNQEQVETSSAVIAVLGDIKMHENAKQIYDANAEKGYMPPELADAMIENSLNLYGNAPEAVLKNIAHFDAGLISMQIMLLAREMGYDTVTMGGFDKVKFAEKYALPANEIPIVLIAIGKEAAPAYGSSRLSIEQILRFS